MQELNFLEIAAVSGGESSSSLKHGFDQPSYGSPRGWPQIAIKEVKNGAGGLSGESYGDSGVATGKATLGDGNSSRGEANAGRGSDGTNGTSNGDGHGF